MKKIIAFLLLVVSISLLSACGKKAATGEANIIPEKTETINESGTVSTASETQISNHNGQFFQNFTWGMSPDEVVASEGREPSGGTIGSGKRHTMQYYNGVAEQNISIYQCIYNFIDLHLRAVTYRINESDYAMDAFRKQIESQYGKPSENDWNRFCTLSFSIDGHRKMNEMSEGYYDNWIINDGTFVAILKEKNAKNYMVFCFDEKGIDSDMPRNRTIAYNYYSWGMTQDEVQIEAAAKLEANEINGRKALIETGYNGNVVYLFENDSLMAIGQFTDEKTYMKYFEEDMEWNYGKSIETDYLRSTQVIQKLFGEPINLEKLKESYTVNWIAENTFVVLSDFDGDSALFIVNKIVAE